MDVELAKRIQLLNCGLTSKLELRQWYFGETERQAREALKNIGDEAEQDMETDLMFSSMSQRSNNFKKPNDNKPKEGDVKDAKPKQS